MPPAAVNLVLDAGPLVSLAPLRGLAQNYFTVPHVFSELRDRKAREHFEQLGLLAGVHIEVRNPDAVSLAKVTLCARQTGDFAVLSPADLSVLALTLSLYEEQRKIAAQNAGVPVAQSPGDLPHDSSGADDVTAMLNSTRLSDGDNDSGGEWASDSDSDADTQEGDDNDSEGEWITPENVALHKSRALDLLPHDGEPSAMEQREPLGTGCMTADYAMQNVLLHMGLDLVDVHGRRITTLKTWVLRCHACFKICKDSAKKFCPSCGNATLLRTSISTKAPETPGGEPIVQVHLKKNYQYRMRGTVYSIPMPKPGSSKTGAGEGLILREDQREWMRAVKSEKFKQEKDERRLLNALKDGRETGLKIGNWDDPDWVPEMLVVGAGGKGRTSRGTMPAVGYGRKNPNERKRRK